MFEIPHPSIAHSAHTHKMHFKCIQKGKNVFYTTMHASDIYNSCFIFKSLLYVSAPTDIYCNSFTANWKLIIYLLSNYWDF